ncbi:hypothetical protein [Streptomyces sp. NPDC048172]|uniref:hypothetical protein n=1 Tax=Streptomyces sp. NPDC048172 TaxID=3365505 RepID=UPI0037138A55
MNERMAQADQFRSPWAPPPTVQVGNWDLEHELAQILHDAAAREETIPQDPVPADPAYDRPYDPTYDRPYDGTYEAPYDPAYDPAFAHAFDRSYDPPGSPVTEPGSGLSGPLGEREAGAGTTPHRRVRGPGNHRRVRRRITVAMVRTSLSFAATGALLVIFVTVSLLSGMVTTGPLRRLVEPVVGDFSGLWPLLIQGPWVAAVLSILRTRTVRGSHALVAWSVLIVFSAVTVALYVTQVPRNPVGVIIGMLPPVAALACLKLLTPHLVPVSARHAGTATKTAPRKRGRKS